MIFTYLLTYLSIDQTVRLMHRYNRAERTTTLSLIFLKLHAPACKSKLVKIRNKFFLNKKYYLLNLIYIKKIFLTLIYILKRLQTQ